MTANNNGKDHNIDIYIYQLEIGSEISSEDDSTSITYLGQTLSLTQRLHNHISGNGKSSKIIHEIIKHDNNNSNIYKVKKILNLYRIRMNCKFLNEGDIGEKTFTSFIDSIRANFENLMYDILKAKKSDFGAYNVENVFKNKTIDQIDNKIKELSKKLPCGKPLTLKKRINKLINKIIEITVKSCSLSDSNVCLGPIVSNINLKEEMNNSTEIIIQELKKKKNSYIINQITEDYSDKSKLLKNLCEKISIENVIEFSYRYLDTLDTPFDINDAFKARLSDINNNTASADSDLETNLLKDNKLIKDSDDNKIEFR